MVSDSLLFQVAFKLRRIFEEHLRWREATARCFSLSSRKEEGRGEEALVLDRPSRRLSPRSFLAGREGAWRDRQFVISLIVIAHWNYESSWRKCLSRSVWLSS